MQVHQKVNKIVTLVTVLRKGRTHHHAYADGIRFLRGPPTRNAVGTFFLSFIFTKVVLEKHQRGLKSARQKNHNLIRENYSKTDLKHITQQRSNFTSP